MGWLSFTFNESDNYKATVQSKWIEQSEPWYLLLPLRCSPAVLYRLASITMPGALRLMLLRSDMVRPPSSHFRSYYLAFGKSRTA